MKALSKELIQRMGEAGKDATWAEKVRSAADWDAYAALLTEKGIEAPSELKESFDAGCASKAGKLNDDELEEISGGWTNVFSCPQSYNFALCELTICPHKVRTNHVPDENHYELRCDLGYWRICRDNSTNKNNDDWS